METQRDLGTVILTQSITKKGNLVGKIQEDGNRVISNGVTYDGVGSWINSITYESSNDQNYEDFDNCE